MAEQFVTDQREKPILDEQTLQKLLEAAFVLQEHGSGQRDSDLQNFELPDLELQSALRARAFETALLQEKIQPVPVQTPSSKDDYTATLGQIVGIQGQIQKRHLEFEKAMALVAESVVEITNASGAAIAILDGTKVQYRAASGPPALPLGSEVDTDKSICSSCLRTGQAFRCADVNPELLIDREDCRRRGVQSLVAVPVYHDGSVAGALELYFAKTHGFTEQDVHTCQLMAGLITEAFARDAELTWKKSLASERATMLEALEKLQPNLAFLTANPSAPKSDSDDSDIEVDAKQLTNESFLCRKCGHALVGEEQFCGKCGTPRADMTGSPSLQSKVASLWQMQQSKATSSNGDSFHGQDRATRDLDANERDSKEKEDDAAIQHAFELGLRELSLTDETVSSVATKAPDISEIPTNSVEPDPAEVHDKNRDEDPPPAQSMLPKSQQEITWSSASKAREVLEALAASRTSNAFGRFWNSRRGDVYLAVAVLMVGAVIRWGIWSNNSVSATVGSPTAIANRHKPAPDADLSMFDKLLIALGLAEGPERPQDTGNPDTQVWVDLHTALYYCPGSELYGKTQKGRFTSQRDAQLDQFEPAYRKACN